MRRLPVLCASLLPPVCVQVAPLWYVAQFTFNVSLSKTSVTSNTILSSTSALFTFLFAIALLAEAFTLWKLGFILLLIVGAWPPASAPWCLQAGPPAQGRAALVMSFSLRGTTLPASKLPAQRALSCLGCLLAGRLDLPGGTFQPCPSPPTALQAPPW